MVSSIADGIKYRFTPPFWGKLAIGLVLLFINAMLVSSYTVKYYSPSIDQKECTKVILSIPQQYFKGLRQISIFDLNNIHISGEYYPQIVYLTNGCDKQVLIHELAHHIQFEKGDTWQQMISHAGNFNKYEAQIKNESN